MNAYSAQQKQIGEFQQQEESQNLPTSRVVTPTPPAAAQIKSIQDAVFFVMDWESEYRDRRTALTRENLWKLTIRIGAILGKKVNPETVARVRRKYWQTGGI